MKSCSEKKQQHTMKSVFSVETSSSKRPSGSFDVSGNNTANEQRGVLEMPRSNPFSILPRPSSHGGMVFSTSAHGNTKHAACASGSTPNHNDCICHRICSFLTCRMFTNTSGGAYALVSNAEIQIDENIS